MATVFLIVIYVIFIGLGIPDSVFGTAWPAIYKAFDVPVSLAGYVSMTVSCGTVVSSVFSSKLINRFGTGIVTAISTVLTAIALLGMAFAPNVIFFFILAIPLGLGAGAIDSGLNNYVAINFKAVHMNFLHCFYGVGVSLSPYIMSLALARDNNWRLGYGIICGIQSVIAVWAFLSLPLWKKEKSGEETASRNLPFSKAVRMPKLWNVWLIFISSCSIEYICGIWGSTFLVNSKGLAAGVAAKIITFYYIGMTLGRFLSGILSMRFTSGQIIDVGKWVVFAAIAILLLPVSPVVAGICLFMIGLGNGPLFPNLLHMTPTNFRPEISQSIMGLQMAGAYIGIMLSPLIFGNVAGKFGTDIFPVWIFVYCVIMVASLYFLNRKKK